MLALVLSTPALLPGLLARGGPAAATATELRTLLIDAVTAGSTPDASRADALIQELADARVPFRSELLGSSASESAIVSSPAAESPLWRACYSSGRTPRWERNAKALGNLFENRAGQAYDARAQRVCNYGEVLGKSCYFTAEGSFSAVDDVRRCPKDFDVAIERGGLVLLGKPFVSSAISGPGYLRVLYLDEELRVFESPTSSPDRWEEAGLRVVQIRERNFE
jgi:hypothetical protein|eukprot:Transcript_19900.p1 GENE.Transcript_19900~~Transcript_19900.p1  ORF type:complete len:223 (-),score=55.83 Transcript_19900:348-1016(-)